MRRLTVEMLPRTRDLSMSLIIARTESKRSGWDEVELERIKRMRLKEKQSWRNLGMEEGQNLKDVVKQKEDGIFISQDKYVTEILKKFGFTDVKTASTPMETQKALLKDEDDSPFDLVAYTNSDYAGASLDRKSSTGGCQFLGYRLISWQCKKQTVVANSLTEDEYVAASSCYRQFWATVKMKTVNGEVQLQALVDGKKMIITEATVRRYLQLKDAKGTECLPNTIIFELLTLMGYEKLSQKFTSYKAFFSP
ncbi:putative ribonuclease H-like domain-containing protein [Tanacetum coccineum]